MRYKENPRLYEAVRTEREKERGLCTDCHVSAATHGVRCASCAEKQRTRTTSRYRRLRALGVCTQCGVTPATGSTCGECAQRWKEKKIAREDRRHGTQVEEG